MAYQEIIQLREAFIWLYITTAICDLEYTEIIEQSKESFIDLIGFIVIVFFFIKFSLIKFIFFD